MMDNTFHVITDYNRTMFFNVSIPNKAKISNQI